MSFLHSFALSFVALFVALDIVGNLPMYISLTHGMSRSKKTEILNTSMWVALGVALLFLFVGEAVFHFLGIAIFDFKMAGGLVLLLISLADLLSGPNSQRPSGSTGVVPLAVPLITGPAVIATLVLQVNTYGHLITIGALLLNYFLGWIVLRNSEKVTDLIGKDGTVIISKIAALMLASIAVSMIRMGFFEAIAAFSANKH